MKTSNKVKPNKQGAVAANSSQFVAGSLSMVKGWECFLMTCNMKWPEMILVLVPNQLFLFRELYIITSPWYLCIQSLDSKLITRDGWFSVIRYGGDPWFCMQLRIWSLDRISKTSPGHPLWWDFCFLKSARKIDFCQVTKKYYQRKFGWETSELRTYKNAKNSVK